MHDELPINSTSSGCWINGWNYCNCLVSPFLFVLLGRSAQLAFTKPRGLSSFSIRTSGRTKSLFPEIQDYAKDRISLLSK